MKGYGKDGTKVELLFWKLISITEIWFLKNNWFHNIMENLESKSLLKKCSTWDLCGNEVEIMD